jgi:hypothetical protein
MAGLCGDRDEHNVLRGIRIFQEQLYSHWLLVLAESHFSG